MRLPVVLCFVTGCIHADRVALATSTATLACDWGYTHRAAARGWADQHEENPIMGPTPTTNTVAAYFTTALVVNAALWFATPARYRAVAPFAITARQVVALDHNAESVGGFCGF